MWCKKRSSRTSWVGVGQKIRLWLHPKSSDCLRLRLLNPGWLDERHGLTPILCDRVTIFVNIDKFSCHCVFIYYNFHREWATFSWCLFVLYWYLLINWVMWNNKSANQQSINHNLPINYLLLLYKNGWDPKNGGGGVQMSSICFSRWKMAAVSVADVVGIVSQRHTNFRHVSFKSGIVQLERLSLL